MLSLSDNEFSVISFLVRNFTEKLTIRSIASRLGFSAAGVFNILKKLEKEGVVVGEKLGTGLFYSINFENKIAEHLSAIVLVYSEQEVEKISVEQLKDAKAAILDDKTLLLVTDSITELDVKIPNIDVIVRTEEEFVNLLRKKDSGTLQVLKKGIVLSGENEFVSMIKKSVLGF